MVVAPKVFYLVTFTGRVGVDHRGGLEVRLGDH